MNAGRPDPPSQASQRPPSIGEPDWEPPERFLDLHSTSLATDLLAGDFMWMARGSGDRLAALELYKHRDTRKTFAIDAAGHAWRRSYGLGWHVYRSPIDAAADLRDGVGPPPRRRPATASAADTPAAVAERASRSRGRHRRRRERAVTTLEVPTCGACPSHRDRDSRLAQQQPDGKEQ